MNTTKRTLLVQTCNLLIENASSIDYPTPAQLGKLRPHKYRTTDWLMGYWGMPAWGMQHQSIWDCSLTCQQATYMTGGIKDPSGFDYSGYGNTESWMGVMKSYTNPFHAHDGAFVVFGADLPAAQQHGCIVIKEDLKGGNPTLMSMGSMPGPLSITLTRR